MNINSTGFPKELARALRQVHFDDEPAYIAPYMYSSDEVEVCDDAGAARPGSARQDALGATAAPDLTSSPAFAPQMARRPRSPIPMARRVAPGARRAIDPQTQVVSERRPAQASSTFNALPQQLARGQWAAADTVVLEPQPPAPVMRRMHGRLQAAIEGLLPADRRYKHDGRLVAAWLRDNGLVALDDDGNDVVLKKVRLGSDRLERLGLLQAFPNLSPHHAAALKEALAASYDRQEQARSDGAAARPGMTELAREVLPKAKSRK